MLGQNDAVGLLTINEGDDGPIFVRPSQKPSQFGQMLFHLQNLTATGGTQLADLMGHVARLIHRRSIVLFFSDLLESAESINSAFQQLRFEGHECLIFQILDRDETEFPFDQGTVFQDLESGQRRNVNPGTVRERYLERFRQFMGGHRELFRSLEMPHVVVETHKDPWEAMSMFLLERKRLV